MRAFSSDRDQGTVDQGTEMTVREIAGRKEKEGRFPSLLYYRVFNHVCPPFYLHKTGKYDIYELAHYSCIIALRLAGSLCAIRIAYQYTRIKARPVTAERAGAKRQSIGA